MNECACIVYRILNDIVVLNESSELEPILFLAFTTSVRKTNEKFNVRKYNYMKIPVKALKLTSL